MDILQTGGGSEAKQLHVHDPARLPLGADTRRGQTLNGALAQPGDFTTSNLPEDLLDREENACDDEGPGRLEPGHLCSDPTLGPGKISEPVPTMFIVALRTQQIYVGVDSLWGLASTLPASPLRGYSCSPKSACS